MTRRNGSWLARMVGASQVPALLAGGRLRTRGAIVLAYHDVGVDPHNTTDFYLSPQRLREQLRTAVTLGLRIVSLDELSHAVADGQPLDGLGAVVFDDSLVGVHHHAMPVLLDLDLPATVFAQSDVLGTSPPWWPGAARVMTAGELSEMAENGFDVVSHTRTHASLPGLVQRRLDDELSGSRHRLEDLLGRPIDLLAYPFGHHDARVREATAAAGYRCAYSFLNGRVTTGCDPFQLPRLNMWPGQGRARMAYHLARPASSWPQHQLDEFSGPEAGYAGREPDALMHHRPPRQ